MSPTAMRQRTLPLTASVLRLAETGDTRLPVWLCSLVILGVSAGCYALLFWVIEQL
jgi:hypothetical protein